MCTPATLLTSRRRNDSVNSNHDNNLVKILDPYLCEKNSEGEDTYSFHSCKKLRTENFAIRNSPRALHLGREENVIL